MEAVSNWHWVKGQKRGMGARHQALGTPPWALGHAPGKVLRHGVVAGHAQGHRQVAVGLDLSPGRLGGAAGIGSVAWLPQLSLPPHASGCPLPPGAPLGCPPFPPKLLFLLGSTGLPIGSTTPECGGVSGFLSLDSLTMQLSGKQFSFFYLKDVLSFYLLERESCRERKRHRKRSFIC